MGIARLLFEIGVPAAIIASLVVWLLSRNSHGRVATAAAIITLVGISAFLVAQLWPAVRDAVSGKVELAIEPSQWDAFTADGEPTEVRVRALRTDDMIAERTFPMAPLERLRGRLLRIQHAEQSARFEVFLGRVPLGHLTEPVLQTAGLVRDLPSPETPLAGGRFDADHTRRLYLGKKVVLNRLTPVVNLDFLEITSGGNALVRLKSKAYGAPSPERIEIPNKGHSQQIFEGKHEYVVMVREADFREAGRQWAAFSVVHMR